MFFIDCEICKKSLMGFDDEAKSWFRVPSLPHERGRQHWQCPECYNAALEKTKLGLDSLLDGEIKGIVFSDEPSPAVTASLLQEAQRRAHSTKDVVGFDRPENGSGDRYQERKAKRPWASHTFWWVVHNVVAHPLIGLLPIRPFFNFHDWTSEKMHGVAR